MNKEIANQKFKFFLKEVERHYQILDENIESLKEYFPLDANKIEKLVKSKEHLKTLDQIAYRYIKLQDTLGKVLRYFLLKEGELVEHLSMVDIIHKIQKLGIFIEEEFWFEMRSLRNNITHEYPDMYEEIAEAINSLASIKNQIKEIIDNIKERA